MELQLKALISSKSSEARATGNWLLRTSVLLFALLLTHSYLQAQSLAMSSGNGQLLADNTVSGPFVVQALDGSGNPAPNVSITWIWFQGEGSLVNASTSTDSNGMASAKFQPVTVPAGVPVIPAVITASSAAGSVDFVITAFPAATPPVVQLMNPSAASPNLTGASGSTLTGAVVVNISTGGALSEVIPNVSLQISSTSSPAPAACNGAMVLSDALGNASCDLVISGSAGSAQLTGVVGGTISTPAIQLTITAPGTPSCNYSISSPNASYAATGGSGSVNVTAGSGCNWTASSNASWINITSGSSGTGNGTVNYSAAANTGSSALSGTMLIAGQTFTVNESAPSPGGGGGGGPAPLAITNTSFPDGVVGQAYQQSLQTSGGCTGAPPTFSVSNGSLPNGMSISGQSITGTPQATGLSSFALQATDSCNNTASGSFSINVDASGQGGGGGGDTVYPSSVNFTVQQNSATPPQNQSVLVNGPSGAYTAAVSAGTPWLVIEPSSNLTIPGLLTLGVANYASLTPGSYSSSVTVTPQDGSTPLTVSVNLTVQAAPFSANPPSFAFSASGSGGTASAVRTISVTSTSAVMQYTASATMTNGANWLFVTPNSGTTPGTLSVTVSPGSLSPGTYNGQIVLTPAFGGAISVPVALTVTAPVMLVAAPTTLLLTPQADGTVAPATVAVSMSDSSAENFTAAATTQSGGNWLSIDSTTGTSPANLTVSVDPQGLAAGQYSGAIAITPSDPTVSALTVPVTLTISATSGPVVEALTNAASFQTGPVAPGEIVVLFGTGLGPSSLAGMSLDAAGLINNQLGGTQVFFDDIAAPMVYSSALQVAAIVPYELGRASTRVRVTYQGASSAPLNLQVAASNPGIFTLNSAGQGAILNQDYTLNSSKNGAEPGKVIFVYATGGGFTNPPSVDGTIATAAASTVLPASVQIDGQDAKVLYAGAAPGLPAGALQVNVEVPKGVHRGVSAPMVLTIGNSTSQSNVTVAIKP
jgi:uncharacterized protein (TIGR03437 family)